MLEHAIDRDSINTRRINPRDFHIAERSSPFRKPRRMLTCRNVNNQCTAALHGTCISSREETEKMTTSIGCSESEQLCSHEFNFSFESQLPKIYQLQPSSTQAPYAYSRQRPSDLEMIMRGLHTRALSSGPARAHIVAFENECL